MDPSPDLVIPRLALRAASSSLAPESESETTSVCLVIVSSLSILGAGFMLMSFLCLPNFRSFRHRLIFGLAVADLLMALNTLISASMDLAHRELGAPRQKVFCAVNGFANQVFVVQQDYWVLLIAICTFILLTDNPIAGAWIQDHQIFLLPLPWLVSIIWAWLGLQVSGGYQSIGSLCWFADGKARLFVNFVPRWIIILTILILYLRIYFVLSRSARIAARQPENARISSGNNPKPARHSFHRGHGGSTTGNAKLKKTARMMIQYPIVYAAMWVIPTGARIYHAATGRDVPFTLHTVALCCVVFAGFVNAITYGVNEAALSSWRTSFSRRPYHQPDPANRPSSFLLRPMGSESSAIRPAANTNRLTVDSHAGFGSGGGGVLDGSTHKRPVSEDRQTVQLPGPEPAYPTVSPVRPAVRITDIAPLPESYTRPWA